MTVRRRKLSSGAAAGAADCNLEDTKQAAAPDGEDRWEGDPEEPEPAASSTKAASKAGAAKPLSAAEPARKDRHPMPWGLVINDVFSMDVHKTFKRLDEALALGDRASEYGTVLHAVDQSAKNLFEASKLARKAKIEDEKFATELDKRLEVLRSAASKALEEEKANGTRSKAPTIKDIEDRMLSSWPDEVASIQARKAEMHGALRSLEALEVAWRERCQSLRTMAQQFKSAGA
jgi:hypothetical protein